MELNIYDFSLDGLRQYLGEVPKFRAEQIYKWLYEQRIENFEEMSNLSIELRKKLDENYIIGKFNIEKKSSKL